MKLPGKDDPHGDRKGALPRADVLEVLRRNGVTLEPDVPGPDELIAMVSDKACETQALTDPVGGMMVRYLARKFDIAVTEFYFYRQLDRQEQAPALH